MIRAKSLRVNGAVKKLRASDLADVVPRDGFTALRVACGASGAEHRGASNFRLRIHFGLISRPHFLGSA